MNTSTSNRFKLHRAPEPKSREHLLAALREAAAQLRDAMSAYRRARSSAGRDFGSGLHASRPRPLPPCPPEAYLG